MRSIDKRVTNGTTILSYNTVVRDAYWHSWYVEGVDDTTFQQWVLPPPTIYHKRKVLSIHIDPTAEITTPTTVITFNDLYD